MLIKKIKKIARSSFYFSATLVMVAQFFGVAFIASQKVSAQGSAAPDGPVKTFIIRYGSLPGEPSESRGVEQNRAKYHWQKNKVMAELTDTDGYKRILRNLSEVPMSIVEVDQKGEESLRANKRIVSITENQILKSNMKDVIPLIGGTVANGFSDGSTNFTGNGSVIAVIDSGFNLNRPELAGGAVISETCYSTNQQYSNVDFVSACPGGAEYSTAAGSTQTSDATGSVTPWQANGHGTATASAAGGRVATDGGDDYSGIAKASKLVLIKALVKFQEKVGQDDFCGDGPTVSYCFGLDSAGLASGLNRVLEIQNSGTLSDPIVAVNNSWGSNVSTQFHSTLAECDSNAISDGYDFSAILSSLKSANIATIFASGNSGTTIIDKVGQPCMSNIVSVGATTRTDKMTTYSSAGLRTDIVAPGGQVSGTNSDGGIYLPGQNNTGLAAWQGTSFSAPIVAGAWGVLREKNSTVTVDTVLRLLQETGTTVTEDRATWTVMNHKRINIDSALAAMANKPSITSLTADGSGFVEGDTVNIDVVAPNATTCTLGSTTINLSGGIGVMPIVATNGSQTYNIVCADAQGYSAVLGVTFSATASSEPPFQGGGGPGDGSVLINGPGTPDTGFKLFLNSPLAIIVSTSLAAFGIILIARKTKITTKAGRR